MDDLLLGGSVMAALVAGAVALFAPCCISVMLPAYLAGSAHNRRMLVLMTFVFAAGIATVIVPLALGASALRRLIVDNHAAVYVAGGLFLIGLALYVFAGGTIRLPTPGRRATGRASVWNIYSLGVFSGLASSCCAPVLAGVVALAGVAESFTVSLVLGVAYVVGMVGPLFAMALVWERVRLREHPLLRPRTLTWRVGRVQRQVSGTGVATSILLAAMGVAMLFASRGDQAMRRSGWQARTSAQLQHYGDVVGDWLGWLPGWFAIVALGIVLAGLARIAVRQARDGASPHTQPARELTTGGRR